MQLVRERDAKHQLPASTVFAEPEIETLEALVAALKGKTAPQQNPIPARSPRPGKLGDRRSRGLEPLLTNPRDSLPSGGMEQFYAIHGGRPLGSRLE